MVKIFEYLLVGFAVAFTVCLIVLMFFYGSPSSTPPQTPQEQHATENKSVRSQSETEKPFWEKATTDPIAAFTLFLVIFTAILSGVGVIQLNMLTRAETLAEKTAQAAKDSAEAALKQAGLMEIDQRPWISLEMQFDDKLLQGETGLSAIIKYSLINVGKSPAFNVDFMAALIPMGEVQPNPPDPVGFSFSTPPQVIDDAIKKVCNDQAYYKSRGWGDIMFPNTPQTKKWRVNGRAGPGYIPGFYIIGCATYKFGNAPTTHHTVRVYELMMGAYGQMINLAEGEIDHTQLVFFPHSENGSRAD